MLGVIYVFHIIDPFLRLPRLQPMRCLHDGEAVSTVSRLPCVTRVTEAGRQVWPRPERPLHDSSEDCA